MKQKLKNYLKFGIFFVGIVFMLYQCQKIDDASFVQPEPKATLNITVTHGDEHFAKSNPKVYNKLKSAGQKNILLRGTEYSDDYDFYFDLDNIQVIERNTYTQYTIIVESDASGDDLLNYLLVVYDDGEESQYLITYPRIQTDEGLEIDHNGATMEELDGSSIMGRGPTSCGNNAPMLVDVVTTWGCTTTLCTGENHEPGDECFCQTWTNGNFQNCARASEDCGWSSVNVWGCGGGGDAGPGPSNGNPGGPDSNPDNNDDEDDALETVALDYAGHKSNCKKLNNLSNSPDFTLRMQELIANTTGNTEIMYYGKTYANGNTIFGNNDRHEGQPDFVGVDAPLPPGQVDSYILNHFNNGNGTLSVFSGSDFYTIYQLYIAGKIDDLSKFVMVVTTPGNNINTTLDDTVYAITISNPTEFIAFGQNFLSDPTIIDATLYNDKKNRIKETVSNSLNEARLTRLLQNNITGMSLSRGNRNDLNSWERLEIKNDNTLKVNNCN